MLKRTLGDTGLEVSPLGIGTVKFGRNAGVGYPRAYELPSDDRIAAVLAEAQRQGINLLDTAPSYGTSEARVGEAIAGHRDEWVISTKAGETFDGAASRYDFSADAILSSVAASLTRLHTDVLDIVLLHSDGRPVAEIIAAGAFRALARLKREGVVRAAGFSGKSPGDAAAALPRSDVLMCTINPGYADEVGIAAKAGERRVGVLVKKPLARGFEGDAETIAGTARLPGVSCVVVGTTSPEHLAADADAIRDGSCFQRAPKAAPGR